MNPTRTIIATSLLAACLAGTASAQLPTPAMEQGPRDAQAYLFYGGAGDVFEITTSMIVLQGSQNPQVRAFASMLIDHHTRLTNTSLGNARAAGVMAPPPELSPQQKAQIGQLLAAGPAAMDRIYLQQQVPAHQMALTLNQGYASSGDVPALRDNARAALPTIRSHLTQAEQLLRQVR